MVAEEKNIRTPSPILCFGEVLWDCLPQGLFAGGAPINVAYHLKQLGWEAVPVTAVGKDFLGEELLRRIHHWGLETHSISSVEDKRTGAVQVELDKHGSAKYKIIEDVAWDWIQLRPRTVELASHSVAIVYGTLAQRTRHNREQLARLLAKTTRALKVYDVNLRPPFDDRKLVAELATHADIIKLNAQELEQLLETKLEVTCLETGARRLAQKMGCPLICITAGASGAGLLQEDKWYWSESRPIVVKDTIGAGDSFLAALVHGLLATPGQAQATLDYACRLAEFVASSAGATPPYTIKNGLVTPLSSVPAE